MLRYGVAAVISTMAALAHLLLAPVVGASPIFTLYYPVVMFCGWYGGIGPGLLSTALCTIVSVVISRTYLHPVDSLAEGDILRLALFTAAGILVSILNETWHRTRRRAEHEAGNARAHETTVQRNEERFRLAAEAVNGIIYEWDAETGHVERSRGLIAVTGYDPDEAEPTQEWWRKKIHPADLPRIDEEFQRNIGEGNIRIESEYRVQGKDGIYRHVLDRMLCTYAPDGKLLRAVGCTIDITAWRRAEVEREQLLVLEQEASANAEAARRQSAFLAEASVVLTASLDHHDALERLVRMIVGVLSDMCLIYLSDDEGLKQEIVLAHYDPSKEKIFRRFAELWHPDPGSQTGPVTSAIRERTSQLIVELPSGLIDDAIDDPELRTIAHTLDPRSAIILPLIARERLLGAMVLVATDSGRHYGDGDLVIAEDLARRTALAIDNARLFEAEQESRRRAESAASRTASIQEITDALSKSVTTQEIASVIVDRIVEATGANRGTLALVSSDGSTIELVRTSGYGDDVIQAWGRFPISLDTMHGRALLTGEPVLLSSYAEMVASYPHLADTPGARDSEGRVSLPLKIGDRVVGAIGLSFAEPLAFDDDDLEYLLALARQCAQALERAWLYEGEQNARAVAEHAQRRLAFLSEASSRLAASLEYDEAVATITRIVVPGIADGCRIDVVDHDGVIQCVAAVHRDRAKEKILAGFPYRTDVRHGIPEVIRTGRPELFASTTSLIDTLAATGEERSAIESLDCSSLLCVPLRAHGRTFGAITMVTCGVGRRLAEDDFDLAVELALRASVALENARLYRDAREEIAKRERMQRVLRENEARLRRLTESNIIGVFTATFDGKIIESNDAFLIMIGYTRDDLREGRVQWNVMTPPEYEPRDYEALERLRTTGVCPPWEKEYIRKDGSRVFVLLGVVMLEHVPDTTICFAVDITEQKRVERELAAAKESAEAASRAKDHFLAVLSHELRTPLTPVLGAVQALYDSTGLEEEDRVLVDIVRRNVELEARLIDDLLDLTRIERGKVQLNFEVVDAHALLGSALEICRDDIASKRQEVSVELDAPRHHAYADPARLQQVFWNLIKNAVKFTPEGGRIAIRSRIAGSGNLQVEVSDTGIGIDRDLLPKIFDAFEQGGRGITRQFGGLGLGLAISRTVMQLHGGKLTASSGGEGEGATFVVELGLLDPITVEPRAPASIPLQESISDPKNIRILLVDDHKDTNRVMQLFLNRQGYQVYAAHTMSSALALAAGKEFDLVISDIGLPDGSGLDLMRKLRSERPVKGIALSGYGMEEDVQRSIEVGFSEHLTKPVSAQRLQEVIQRIITADVEGLPAV